MTRADLPAIPVAVAGGQFLLLALPAGGIALVAGEVILLAALLASLLVETPRHAWPSVVLAAFTVGVALGGMGLLASVATDGRALWIVAGAVALAAVLASYGLHRYELVAVGLVESDAEPGGGS